jgi:polyhydroxyalkanoate synthesis regulator phasin
MKNKLISIITISVVSIGAVATGVSIALTPKTNTDTKVEKGELNSLEAKVNDNNLKNNNKNMEQDQQIQEVVSSVAEVASSVASVETKVATVENNVAGLQASVAQLQKVVASSVAPVEVVAKVEPMVVKSDYEQIVDYLIKYKNINSNATNQTSFYIPVTNVSGDKNTDSIIVSAKYKMSATLFLQLLKMLPITRTNFILFDELNFVNGEPFKFMVANSTQV